ncbi:potassium-transporting ATPase subunit C [Chryseobacterium formosense]|uniref:Potassium-transporting ATPase KdpC subunit n=1 Tax=Chryseobacterium formosense TaxID=236814 RepID=A0A085YYJ4_9FLAO|nr:K(+)-transporting ATPase subunit C [Chryseobacterium formosense]KFE97257.1 potassium-transporting ATPase subunit C [Chryseobacterium formosense]SFT64569.1 K+-transporting ATPase ATPase C chain [Chryseobacterium formosense]
MKKHILPAVKLTVLSIILLTIVYPAIIWAIAQFSPNGGKGELITHNNKIYYSNIGQSFSENRYFWSRPSAVDYNSAGSGGSNKGPSNEEYLKQVQARVDTFLMKNPGVAKSEIPVDLITASGSGLDPDFSVQAAKVQVKRIAQDRNISQEKINQLIEANIQKPFLGLFGPEKINVLKLNIALDQLGK